MYVIFGVDFVEAQKRPRVTALGGRPRLYDPRECKAFKQAIALAYKAALNSSKNAGAFASKDTPVELIITTHRKKPASVKYFDEDTHKPDADNIAKLVMDALNGVAYADDAQVTKLTVKKDKRTEKPDITTVQVIWE